MPARGFVTGLIYNGGRIGGLLAPSIAAQIASGQGGLQAALGTTICGRALRSETRGRTLRSRQYRRRARNAQLHLGTVMRRSTPAFEAADRIFCSGPTSTGMMSPASAALIAPISETSSMG